MLSTGSNRPILDEWQQELANLATAERACRWSLGDTIVSAIKAAATKKARAGIFRAAASILHCSAQQTRIMATVAATFPVAHRHADVPFSVYRAVAQVAKRLQRDPLAILVQVLEDNLGVLAILAIDRHEQTRFRLAAECGECGARTVITARFKLDRVVCGYCIARLHADGLVGVQPSVSWPLLGGVS